MYRYSTFDMNYIYSMEFTFTFAHDIYVFFLNIFDSFILVFMLNTFIFKSFVLLATHTLLDRSLRVLQLPVHLPKLTTNG